MININNKQDFIQFIKSIKELNKKHAINCQKTLQIKNATGYNLSNIASDPIIRDEYAKDVLMIDTTNKILQYVFNGLMCTIKPNEMTTTQNQFINAHFAEPQNHSLEEKQKMIKNNFLQQGMGNFNFAPLYNNYELGSQYFSNNNSLFDKMIKNYWNAEKEIFLPMILNVEKEKVMETLYSFKTGDFQINLSSESKKNLFEILYTHDNFYEKQYIDKEISDNNNKKR